MVSSPQMAVMLCSPERSFRCLMSVASLVLASSCFPSIVQLTLPAIFSPAMFIYPNVMVPRLSARLFSGRSHVNTVVWLLSGRLTVP